MATEKKITSRIQQKHDVAANWAKATNFIPKKGEIIIYDAEYNASGEETQAVRFKIGDGSKTVNNLPFAVIDYSSDIETLEQKVANNSTAIGALQENTVPKTRKINNKALSSDITLGAADVGVNETTFPGLKKTGTVTGVKMNGTTKTPSSGIVDIGTVLTEHQSLDGKQDKITSSNKLAASLVSGLATVATSGSYNDLANIPVINQDLTASGFTPVANTYYRHTGTTTDTFTNGVIYLYNGTGYAALGESGSGGGKTYVYYVTGDGQSVEYDIKHPFGADVNVSVYRTGQSIFGETMNKLVLVDVYTKPKKVKLVFSSAPSSGMKFKVVITGVELENVVTFEEESWANIRKIVLTGNASKHWDIGDTKSITSKSGKTYKIRLADLQDGRYEYSDGSGSSKAVFEFVECYNLNNTIGYRMNSTATNVGGWAASEMRSQTMPTLLADLPDDMVAAMSQVKVLSSIGGKNKTDTSSSNNTLFIPATIELFDNKEESIGLAESPLGQFDYYKANNIGSARIKYVVGETTMTPSHAKLYWNRSPYAYDSTAFCGVEQLGDWDLSDANYSNFAIAPIFAI